MKNKKTKTELFSQFQKESNSWWKLIPWIVLFIGILILCIFIARLFYPVSLGGIIILFCGVSILVIMVYRYAESISEEIESSKSCLENLKKEHEELQEEFSEMEQKCEIIEGITEYLQSSNANSLWVKYMLDITETNVWAQEIPPREYLDSIQRCLDESENEVYEQETKIEFYTELAAKKKKQVIQ